MPDKISKTEADYGEATMKSTRCGNCIYYLSGGMCQRVIGRINPGYWCKLWRKKG
jgi:hypothetical protein